MCVLIYNYKCLIPTYNILVIILYTELMTNLALLTGFNTT